MKPSLIGLLILCFCVKSTRAQNQRLIDSLSNLLETGISDERRVDALIKLGWEYFYTDSLTFRKHLNHAIRLAEEIEYPMGKTDAMHTIGRSYILTGYFDHARDAYQKTIQLAKTINYPKGLSHGINGLGHLKIYSGEYDSAIYYYQKATAMLEGGNYPKVLGACYQNLAGAYLRKSDYSSSMKYYDLSLPLVDNSEKYKTYMGLGSIYYYQGLYAKALENQFKALELQENAGFAKAIAAINGNIAINYTELGELEKAKEYHERTISIFEENNDQDALALAYNNISALLRRMGNLDLAKNYLNMAISIYESRSPNEYLTICYRNLGEIAFEKKDFIAARDHFQHALELGEKLGIKSEISNALLSLGRCCVALKKYPDAEQYLLKAISLAEELNNIRNLQDGYRALTTLEKERGDYAAALSAFEKYKLAEDSISSVENAKHITRVEMEYKFQKERDSVSFMQEKAALAYQKTLNERQWMLTGAAGFVILLVVIAVLAFRSSQIKRKANKDLSIANDDLRNLNNYLKEFRAREKELSEIAIATKERELASLSMASHEKNALLKDLEQQMSFLEKRLDDEMKPTLKELKKTISNGYSLDNSWSSFLHTFQDVHPNFFDRLKSENPQLSNDDLKLSAYLKIGMSNKEIANVINLTPGSVKTKVNRLKKKLMMAPDDNLRKSMEGYGS